MDKKTVGTLYLVGTPIGNLEDISLRAIRILKEVDVLFCEDTRRTAVLLKKFNIEKTFPLQSFHEHTSTKVIMNICKLLQQGKTIGYATDAGLPVISDPGFLLVKAALSISAEVSVIPGPSAVFLIFVLSAFPSAKFLFHAFFPRGKKEIEKVLQQVQTLPIVHVFYESPHRLLKTLNILQNNIPQAQIALGKELTKKYEEVLRGTPEELLQELSTRKKIQGEYCLALLNIPVKNSLEQPAQQVANLISNDLNSQQQEEVKALVHAGTSSKDTAKFLAKKFGVPRRLIYEFIIRHLT